MTTCSSVFTRLLAAGLLVQSIACHSSRNLSQTPPAIDSTLLKTHFQERKDFSSHNGRVHFSNQFAGARLDSFTQENDSSFRIDLIPENEPINPSPWYAFKIWSATPGTITVHLHYTYSRHRYAPHISKDAQHWKAVKGVIASKDEKDVRFLVPVSADTVWIAAQEIMNTAANRQWADSLAQLPFMQQQLIGHSLLGKPITALHNTNSTGKKLVVVLSRQHPPEVTGYMAMKAFVNTILGNSELANRFRQQYELVLIPLLNPDGVDEGNWRHSAAGVDLNRDWDLFKQPETRAVKDYLQRLVQDQQAKVYFGLDFHSTYHDVFYTNEDTIHTNNPGFTNRWLRGMEQAIDGFNPSVKPSGNGGNVSKSWLMRALHAEALTYEVGDDTPRPRLQLIGRTAAEVMMQQLLATNP